MFRLRVLVALFCSTLAFLANLEQVLAQETRATSRSAVLGPIERYTLPNGLRVVLNPIPGSVTAGVCLTFDVGSRDEREGRTGVAHLFEHLMFQGSLNVEAGEHARLVTARGGNLNGVATKEATHYYTEIPAGELELALWLEADRLFRLALTRQNFESQRTILLEELRQRDASKVYSRGQVRLHELVFQRHWAYEHPAWGYLRDLEAAEYAWVRQFHEEHYRPSRAVLAIAGGFDPIQVRAWIENYFNQPGSKLDAPPDTRPSDVTLPRQTSERFSVLEDRNARTPGVYFGWRIPGARTPDNHALRLASFILTGNETSRLKEQLVSDEQLALNVRSETAGYSDADIFEIFVELNRRSTVDAMQKSLEKTLTHLAVVGPTAQELERARLNLELRWLQRMEKARNRAMDLAELESTWGDATQLTEDYTAFASITPAQVRAAVARHLVNTRRTIVEVYPPGWVRDIGPTIITTTYIVKPGDNLTRIAQWHGTTPEAVAKQNGIEVNRRLVIGQRLLITANPSKIVKPVTHTVAKGETLIGIGRRYGVDAADIAKRNGLNAKKTIRPGQILQIPPRPKATGNSSEKSDPKSTGNPAKADPKNATPKSGATTSAPTSAPKTPSSPKGQTGAPKGPSSSGNGGEKANTPAPKPVKTYVVKPGDSLSVIAARHKISVAALTRANGISQKKPIRPGQRLVIPAPE
jgi:zinc protease